MYLYIWNITTFRSVYKEILSNLQKTYIKMETRARLWVTIFSIYLIILILIYFFKVPLKSKTLHSHYDLSGERVLQNHQLHVNIKANEISQQRIDMDNMNEAKAMTILRETFHKADKNDDQSLDIEELINWISQKIKDHLLLAVKENFFIFTAVDKNPRNGAASWKEYQEYFLRSHGYDEKFIANNINNYRTLPREIREALMYDKAAWAEAARNDPLVLSIDEFLAFRHPESSHASILSIVEDTFARLDLDEDGSLSPDEFSDPVMNEVPMDMSADNFKLERKLEFANIDTDKNGFIEKKEMLMYIDPRNTHHAEKEAFDLLTISDTNADNVLSLSEVLEQWPVFMASKMVDVAKSFHDEF